MRNARFENFEAGKRAVRLDTFDEHARDGVEVAAQAFVEGRRRRRVQLLDGAQRGGQRQPGQLVGTLTAEQLVGQHAQGVHVAARVHVAAGLALFGAHPAQGAEDAPGLGGAGGVGRVAEARDAEVEHLGPRAVQHAAAARAGGVRGRVAVGGGRVVHHQHVGGLQVAVHHAAGVGVVHGVGEARQQLDALAPIEAPGRRVLQQRLPLHQLHGEPRAPLPVAGRSRLGRRAGLVQARDARVLQAPERFGLAPQPLQQRRARLARVHHLQRPEAARVLLLGAVDHAHAAAAEHLEHLEALDVGQGAVARADFAHHLGVHAHHRRVQEARARPGPFVVRQQREHLGALGVVGGLPGHPGLALARRPLERLREQRLHPVGVGHGTSPSARVRCSQARAKAQSRSTVAGEMPRASAVSGTVSPAKWRSITT